MITKRINRNTPSLPYLPVPLSAPEDKIKGLGMRKKQFSTSSKQSSTSRTPKIQTSKGVSENRITPSKSFSSKALLQQLPPIKREEQAHPVHRFRHLIFAPNVNEMLVKRHLLQVQRGLQYSKRHLRGPSENLLKQMSVEVKKSQRTRMKALFLDLDETLIHSCQPNEDPDVMVDSFDDIGVSTKIPIKMRPFCLDFLKQCALLFDVYIFTASSSNYASGIIKYLDPENQYIKQTFCRNKCMETKNGLFIKDLRIFSNLLIKDVVLVDNLSHSFGFQIFNGIPILEFRQDKQDRELVFLLEYLKDLSVVDDVRELNKERLRLHELLDFNIEDIS